MEFTGHVAYTESSLEIPISRIDTNFVYNLGSVDTTAGRRHAGPEGAELRRMQVLRHHQCGLPRTSGKTDRRRHGHHRRLLGCRTPCAGRWPSTARKCQPAFPASATSNINRLRRLTVTKSHQRRRRPPPTGSNPNHRHLPVEEIASCKPQPSERPPYTSRKPPAITQKKTPRNSNSTALRRVLQGPRPRDRRPLPRPARYPARLRMDDGRGHPGRTALPVHSRIQAPRFLMVSGRDRALTGQAQSQRSHTRLHDGKLALNDDRLPNPASGNLHHSTKMLASKDHIKP